MNQPPSSRPRPRPLHAVKRHLAFRVAVVLGIALAAVGHADECSVPATHGSIAAAIADLDCDTVQLDAVTYTEDLELDRLLILSGPAGGGAVLHGVISVTDGVGGLLRDLAIETPCGTEALSVLGLADLTLEGVELRTLSDCTVIFQSGFENGGLDDWIATGAAPRSEETRQPAPSQAPIAIEPTP